MPHRHTAQVNHGAHVTQHGPQAALGRMAALLQMEERLRRADSKELPFIAVNETRMLLPYRQAVLWRAKDFGGPEVMAVSGLAVPDKNSPYIQWLSSVYSHMYASMASNGAGLEPQPFTVMDLPEGKRADWADWLPPHAVFVPLPMRGCASNTTNPQAMGQSPKADGAKPSAGTPNVALAAPAFSNTPASDIPEPGTPAPAPAALPELFGALAFFSQHAFSTADLRAIQHLAGAYAQALSLAFAPKAKKVFYFSRRIKVMIVLALLVVFFPVRQSVLAPAEVIAKDPWPVRAPLEGVVDSIVVAPNAVVTKGQMLLKLDTTELETRLAVAAKSLGVARAELRQAQQQALIDREAKLRLAYLSGRLEQLEAEKSYVESLIERAFPQSLIDGVALVDAPEEWAGKPVSLGQRIMTVADPKSVRLEIFLPSEEYIPQNVGDVAAFFSNNNPGTPVDATIYQIGFQAQETPQVGMAFRLRADFAPDQSADLRLGLRGSAKLYGSRAPLIFTLLRKPMAKLRQWVGVF